MDSFFFRSQKCQNFEEFGPMSLVNQKIHQFQDRTQHELDARNQMAMISRDDIRLMVGLLFLEEYMK